MDLCHFWHFSALLMTDVFQNDLGRSLGYFLSWPGYEGAEPLAAETQRMNQNFRKLETWLEHCHHMTRSGAQSTRILQRFSNNQIIFIGPRSKISWVHTSLLSTKPAITISGSSNIPCQMNPCDVPWCRLGKSMGTIPLSLSSQYFTSDRISRSL